LSGAADTPAAPDPAAADAPVAAPPVLRGRDVILVFVMFVGLMSLVVGILVLLGVGLQRAGVIRHIRSVFAPTVAVTAPLVLAQAAAMGCSGYLVAIRWRGVSWSALGFRPFARHWYATAPLLAVGLALGVHQLDRVFGEPLSEQIIRTLAPEGFTWWGLAAMLAVGAGAAPLAEEMLFRGVLYSWLRRRWGAAVAVIASSAVFGAFHLVPYWIVFAAVLGAVLAVIREKSGSLWPAVFVHMAYNAVAIGFLYATLYSAGPPGP
jgi:membrane protease YdiL (CAAX protease family)